MRPSLLVVALLLWITTFSFAQQRDSTGQVVDKFMNQLRKAVKYPLKAKQAGAVGFADITFKVDNTGEIQYIKTLNAGKYDNDFEQEVKTIVQKLSPVDLRKLSTGTGHDLFLLSAGFGIDVAPKRATARPEDVGAYTLPEFYIVGYR